MSQETLPSVSHKRFDMRGGRKHISLCLLTVIGASLMFACAKETELAPSTPLPTETVHPMETIAPSPTPTPQIERLEPERVTADLSVPFFYSEISTLSDGSVLYAFTDANGVVVYRTTGVVRTLTDGTTTDMKFDFFEADEFGALAGTNPIETEEEQPGVCVPASTEGLRIRRALVPLEHKSSYRDSRRDAPNYIVYGTVGGGEPAFYPATESGEMIPGALPLTSESYLVSTFAPQRSPEKDGERHITVFIGTQSVVVFCAVDGDWEIEHVFICSTGDGGKYTPRGNFRITAQYEYKAMSRMNGVMVYAQYSSRFQGHYLFHTVPTAGQYKNYAPNGKQQMLIAEYEKLGTDVSHGCVRMLVGDCYWIYRNCRIGTSVTVTDEEGPRPPERPALIYEEPYMDQNHEYGWDPTDPSPNNPYLALEEYAAAMIVPTLAPAQAKTARPTKAATPRPTATPTPKPTRWPILIPKESAAPIPQKTPAPFSEDAEHGE